MEFTTNRKPPPNRVGNCDGPFEQHLLEAAVMLALSQWLFTLGAEEVTIHPDGMHVRDDTGFDIRGWLEEKGFKMNESYGTTRHGGVYESVARTVRVDFRPGCGDVVAVIGGVRILVEAKGGCINTNHPGLCSKLRKHLYEAVGMLMDDRNNVDRLIVAVPLHRETEKIAERVARKCRTVGIEIVLVSGDGNVRLVNQ